MADQSSDTDKSPLPRRHPWIAIAVLAFVVREIYLYQYLTSDCNGFLFADMAYYRNWAMQILDGGPRADQVFQQGPLYAYLLAAQFGLGISETGIILLQMIVGISTCVLVYQCGRQLFDHKTAIVAGCISAIYGPLIFYECMLMKSFFSPFLTMMALFFGLRYRQTLRLRFLLFAAFTIGCACLLREVYLLLLFPLMILALRVPSLSVDQPESQESAPKIPHSLFKTRMRNVAFLAMAFLVPIVPVTIRNKVVANEFALVTVGGGEVMYIAHGPFADGYWNSGPIRRPNAFKEHEAFHEEAERRLRRPLARSEANRYWYGQAFQSIIDQPSRFVTLTLAKAVILLNDYEYPDSANIQAWPQYIPILSLLPSFGWIVGLGTIGICLAARHWREFDLPLGMLAMHVVGVILIYNFGRFRIGMMPLWILFVAFAITKLPTLFRNTTTRHRIGGVVLILVSAAVTLRAFALPPGISEQKLQSQNSSFHDLVEKQANARTELKSLEKLSDSAQVHSHIASTLLVLNRVDESIARHRKAIQWSEKNADIRFRFGSDLMAAGRTNDGIKELQTTIQLDFRYASAHELIAKEFHQQGRLTAAIHHYSLALRFDKKLSISANNLALILMSHPRRELRNSARAVELAERAYKQVGSDPSVMDTLAAAYAADGQFDKAIEIADLAIQAALKSGNDRLAAGIAKSRELYERSESRWP